MKKNKEGVIPFDVDGVLNEGSTQLYIRGIDMVLESCDIKLDPTILRAEVLERWGRPPRRILLSLIDFAHENQGSTDHQAINKMKRHATGLYDTYMATDFINDVRPVAGAQETLEELKERYELGLNTSADKSILFEHMLPKLGIDPGLFTGNLVWTADDVLEHQEKPDPYVINRILKASGFEPEQAVMVGDSATDVLSAHFANVEPVVPLTGNLTEEQARELGVEYVVPDITYLRELLPRLIGSRAFDLLELTEQAI